MIQELGDSAKSGFVPPYLVVRNLAALGVQAKVLEWLGKAKQGERQLTAEPAFDRMRSDPRFI